MQIRSLSKSVSILCVLAVVFGSLSCCPSTSQAQTDRRQPAQTAQTATQAYTPPPDRMIYFRVARKEKTVKVSATNLNVPELPLHLNYLKFTDEVLEDMGYLLTDRRSRAAIHVRVTVSYNEVENSQDVVSSVDPKAAAGAIIGVLGTLVWGGVARDLVQGKDDVPVQKFLTLEFEISSKGGGLQTGQVTKDISDVTVGLEEFIDDAIAYYLEAAFPKKR